MSDTPAMLGVIAYGRAAARLGRASRAAVLSKEGASPRRILLETGYQRGPYGWGVETRGDVYMKPASVLGARPYGTLEEMADVHPDVERAYPGIGRELRVEVVPDNARADRVAAARRSLALWASKGDTASGFYDRGNHLIAVRAQMPGESLNGYIDRADGTVTHEVQHYAQERDGIRPGGPRRHVDADDYREDGIEVDARNSAARRKLTPEERVEMPRSMTQDVKPEDVRRDDKGGRSVHAAMGARGVLKPPAVRPVKFYGVRGETLPDFIRSETLGYRPGLRIGVVPEGVPFVPGSGYTKGGSNNPGVRIVFPRKDFVPDARTQTLLFNQDAFTPVAKNIVERAETTYGSPATKDSIQKILDSLYKTYTLEVPEEVQYYAREYSPGGRRYGEDLTGIGHEARFEYDPRNREARVVGYTGWEDPSYTRHMWRIPYTTEGRLPEEFRELLLERTRHLPFAGADAIRHYGEAVRFEATPGSPGRQVLFDSGLRQENPRGLDDAIRLLERSGTPYDFFDSPETEIEAIRNTGLGTQEDSKGGDTHSDSEGGDNFGTFRNFLATDDVPESIFGYPVVQDEAQYTEKDLEFFKKNPKAAGFYDLGDEEVDEDVPQQAAGAGTTYDTPLTKDQEAMYQKWRATLPKPLQYEGDYDLRGYWLDPRTVKDGIKDGQHFTDTYKKPNHPTFSVESKYAVGANLARAGRWEGEKFIPPRGTYPGSLNNPGNVEKRKERRQGEVDSPHERFAKFATPQDGLREMADVIRQIAGVKLAEKGQAFTVRNFAEVYAPRYNKKGKKENDTDKYIADISADSGFGPDEELHRFDGGDMARLLKSVVRFESGVPHSAWFTDEEYAEAARKLQEGAVD